MTSAEGILRAAVARRGPLPLEEVVDLALYHPEVGFYSGAGHAGRDGDFLTSPEVGPLFGTVVARALDAWWRGAGEPHPFVVVEAGAGPGSLARSVLAARPACSGSLRYVLVERSAAQRARHAERFSLETDGAAFVADPDVGDDDSQSPSSPDGPIVVSRPDLPRLSGPAVVLANELLDNLPFGLLERQAEGWAEVRVGVARGALVERLVPVTAGPAVEVPLGARVPRQRVAADWVQGARDLAGRGGRVVAIDYASTTAELASRPWTDWVRTYRRHARGTGVLEDLGEQDITCEVAVDQLGVAPTSDRSQADWLSAHGIDEVVDAARRSWRDRAAIGDLEAIRSRSTVSEGEALLDPSGLGAFRVLEWET